MMHRPRPTLAEQVVVVTGASSGIGLATVRLAAERGARVVAAARSPEIESIVAVLRDETEGAIEAVVGDVSVEDDLRRIAACAIDRFGRIDTWINNAGSTVYGRSIDVPLDDMRELFETDFWGVVMGSRIAIEHLRDHGGTLINVGSVVSDRAVPLQGVYSAAKHAVKAFTDALRMELEHDHVPVNVTLVKPATIDTPFFAHAKSHLDEGTPAPSSPVYSPEAVAEVLLQCAVKPVREISVGLGGRAHAWLGRVAPRLADRIMQRQLHREQVRSEPHEKRTQGPGEERGDHRGRVIRRSVYASLRSRPVASSVVAAFGAVLVAIGAVRAAQQG